MNVRVDEAGAHERVRVMRHGRIAGQARQDVGCRAAIDDASAGHHHDRVALVTHRRVAGDERVAVESEQRRADRRRLGAHGYCRAVRTFAGMRSPASLRKGLMSMPPRRVKRAYTDRVRAPQRDFKSMKMRSTQCSWNPAWQRYDTR